MKKIPVGAADFARPVLPNARCFRGQFVGREVLADCPHRHLVFSIPKMFRILIFFNRKLLVELARCVWRAIRQYLEASASEDLLPATAGDFLNWNPHIHALIASGGFHSDGSFEAIPFTAGKRPERTL